MDINEMKSRRLIYTIGHGNHALPQFLALLSEATIELVVDVRSFPASRYVPHFNKKALQASLAGSGIDYLYLGDLLGGRPADYEKGHPLVYEDAIKRGGFQEGLARLFELSTTNRCAVMCAEKDPNRCHRRYLISRALIRRGVEVTHILGDGTLVPEEEFGLAFGDR
jgi:uncharacterized protein (DUF488 family)